MSWVKRNLYFLVGGGLAAALLGLSGFYLFSKWQQNNRAQAELKAAYDELDAISRLNPNPGNSKINNIKTAREQEAQLRGVIEKYRAHFVPIPSIPGGANVSSESFASALRLTVRELENAASRSSVTLPQRYTFTFEAQWQLVKFAPGLDRLATQLGEIKAICNVLFQAKVNSLDNIRRERVTEDDILKGAVSDYLEATALSVTNELAVLTPVEVTFHAFSAELAAVLAGFANDPHGIIIKTINVEPGDTVYPGTGYGYPGAETTGGGGMLLPGERPLTPGYALPGVPPPGMGTPITPAAPVMKGGMQVLLDEKPLRVTMVLNIVKLLPKP